MRNLLKFAENRESDCFLTNAEAARGILTIYGFYGSLSLRLPGKQLEVNTQHKMKFAAVRSTVWKYSFTSILCQEKSFLRTEPAWGWGARHRACRKGSHETPASSVLPREHGPGSLEAVLAGCLLSVGSRAGHPILWA